MDSPADSSVQPTFKHLLDTSPGGAERDEAAAPPLAQSHGNRHGDVPSDLQVLNSTEDIAKPITIQEGETGTRKGRMTGA